MENDILTLAALVASYVGIIKKMRLFPSKYNPVAALVIAAIVVLSPERVQHYITMVSIVGLMAVGAYHQIKNEEVGKK